MGQTALRVQEGEVTSTGVEIDGKSFITHHHTNNSDHILLIKTSLKDVPWGSRG